jgi:hypothetical protein
LKHKFGNMDIPNQRDSNPKIWKLRSGNLENWPNWKDHDIVSVGWNIGPIRGDVTDTQGITDKHDRLEAAGKEIENRITDKFFEDGEGDPSNAYGTVRTVTATREDRYFAPGDFVVVFGHKIRGEPVIHGVAELEKYVGRKYNINKEPHPYQWEVEYLAKGPVRKCDLPSKFDGGDLNLFLRPTLWEYHDASSEDIIELADHIQELTDNDKGVSLSQSYFEYDEGDMQRYIGDNISQLDEDISHIRPEYWINPSNRADFYCELSDDSVLLIETKQHTATTDHLNQLRRYITEFEKEEDQSAMGLLIAPGFREETISMAQQENIKLRDFIPSAEFPVVGDSTPSH